MSEQEVGIKEVLDKAESELVSKISDIWRQLRPLEKEIVSVRRAKLAAEGRDVPKLKGKQI